MSEIVQGLAAAATRPSVVSIGFFDGVHRGHQAILRRAVEAAGETGMWCRALTFDRHPMEVVNPGSQPKLLMTPARRAATIAEQGVDEVIVLPFDDELRHRSAEEFVDEILVQALAARGVVIGSNFRFGHKAAGDVRALERLGATRGFATEAVELLTDDSEAVSSTAIRGAVEQGEVALAQRMLGRPHRLDGVVVRGDGRGANLGFPTANLQVSRRVAVPGRGVYAGKFHHPDGRILSCATNVGINPQFGGQELRVEAYLIDFDEDLYGLTVGVDFRHRLRDERRFAAVDDLVAAMKADVTNARELLDRA